MSLQPGRTLAHYEIVEPIGKGGMGEVYRARDSKLGRDVAIKVLPDELAQDKERLERFQREAQILASLNHPNIASIYGVEESEGTHCLVLELVGGVTLSERIARSPIPVDEAREIALQIAEALEEAHAHGIVHRDLKPENIKLTPDGKVKVLDFGLAKTFAEDPTGAEDSNSPTLAREVTRAGALLGTAPYMSPEQARGQDVDERSDIWSFGCVLWECLTRQKLFGGPTLSDSIGAILHTEPDWGRLPADTPPTVRRLLRRCLAKDLRQRLHHITDARIELEDPDPPPPAAGGSTSSAPAASSHGGTGCAARPLWAKSTSSRRRAARSSRTRSGRRAGPTSPSARRPPSVWPSWAATTSLSIWARTTGSFVARQPPDPRASGVSCWGGAFDPVRGRLFAVFFSIHEMSEPGCS